MKLFKHRTSGKRRLLLSIIPAFFCSNLLANTLKKYLKRPLQIIFPIPFAGSINREIPMRMFESSGIDYFIENKFGASGLIATRYLKEDTTGNTLMVATNTILLTNFIKNSNKVANDFEEVFQCVGMMYRVPFVLVTKSGSRFDVSFKEFVDRLKKSKVNPTYSIYGYYDIVHLCGLMLSKSLKLELKEIPYKNSYLLPVLAGEVDFSFIPLSAAIPFINSSQLSAIAHTSEGSSGELERMYALGTLKDFYSMDAVYGLVASKFMPQEVILELNALLSNVLSDLNFVNKQSSQGIRVFPKNSPNDYLQYLRSEKKKYETILGKMG